MITTRVERSTLNGQTIRVDTSEEEVKISVLKGSHFRAIAKLTVSDGVDLAKAILAAAEGEQ